MFERNFFIRDDLHISVTRFTEDFTVPYHEHDFIEYCYVAEGTGFHHTEQETLPIHKGLLITIPIGVSHVFRPSTPGQNTKPPVVYNCLFDAELANRISLLHEVQIREHLSSLRSKSFSYFSVFDRHGEIEGIMLKLHREMSMQEIGSQAILYSLVNELIVTVYRLKYGEKNPDHLTNKSTHFQHVLFYLKQNLHQAITLSELSRLSGWSTRHLQRLFHQHTGQSFGSYLLNLRIQKSCDILRNSDLKISLIAENVGYYSIDAFNAAFKKIVGLTPTEYRKYGNIKSLQNYAITELATPSCR
ncbi:AraC family transcriptional regulator [Paenibacillus sp. GYB006]|uniref:AraC family transcriptional regulator n=1 Tax=Paenibacillus sp. GYB006 TaxID=2994394 RepID=UPI002F96BCDF